MVIKITTLISLLLLISCSSNSKLIDPSSEGILLGRLEVVLNNSVVTSNCEIQFHRKNRNYLGELSPDGNYKLIVPEGDFYLKGIICGENYYKFKPNQIVVTSQVGHKPTFLGNLLAIWETPNHNKGIAAATGPIFALMTSSFDAKSFTLRMKPHDKKVEKENYISLIQIPEELKEKEKNTQDQ